MTLFYHPLSGYYPSPTRKDRLSLEDQQLKGPLADRGGQNGGGYIPFNKGGMIRQPPKVCFPLRLNPERAHCLLVPLEDREERAHLVDPHVRNRQFWRKGLDKRVASCRVVRPRTSH
jgi:hypothetical protein